MKSSYLVISLFAILVTSSVTDPGGKKTLVRQDDSVVVAGSKLMALAGVPLDRLALMTYRNGAWSPAPFQIDEKLPDGAYAFHLGPMAARDPVPGVDPNDELIFMVKDCGDRAYEPPPGVESVLELSLTDPKDKGEGWLYLARFAAKAPRSNRDYIRLEVDYAAETRRVITSQYVLGGPSDRVYPDFLAWIQPDGKPGDDVLDRLKMRGEILLPMGLTIPFDLDDMTKAEDKGWVDGPIRVLHYADGYLEIAGYFKIRAGGYSLLSFYENQMSWPMTIDIPGGGGASNLARVVNFRGYMDFNNKVYGSHSFSAANPLNQEVVFDGRMNEAEKNLDAETAIDWIAGFGEQGALVSRLFFSDNMEGLVQSMYYLDDAGVNDAPEDFPGSIVSGYFMKSLDSLESSGPVTAYQYYNFMSRIKPDEVHRILDILDYPVKVEIKNLARAER